MKKKKNISAKAHRMCVCVHIPRQKILSFFLLSFEVFLFLVSAAIDQIVSRMLRTENPYACGGGGQPFLRVSLPTYPYRLAVGLAATQ